jgi:hypothetical protein
MIRHLRRRHLQKQESRDHRLAQAPLSRVIRSATKLKCGRRIGDVRAHF